MSLRLTITDSSERVLFDQTLSDQPVSGFMGDEGTNATVLRFGEVIVQSPHIAGSYELVTGRRVNGEGLKLYYSEEPVHVDLLQKREGVVTALRVRAETLSSSLNPERR